MRNSISIAAIAGALLLALVSCRAPVETTSAGVGSLDGAFDRSTLLIESDDGSQHTLDIYLASSFEQQRRGLMFVRKMPENTGMLFVYDETDYHSMWMKNTYI